MSILEELEVSLHSDAPCYIEFLYRYNPKKKQAFAFYEGDEDSSYYHQFLVQNLDANCDLEEIVAGCKNNVLKLNREFDWTIYNKNQILFFVDRDLSFWLDEKSEVNSNVFITDGYSVENYIVNSAVFRCWLTRYKGFSRARKQEIDHMVEVFVTLWDQFINSAKPVMAQAVIAKRLDKSISLSDYKISKCLQFSIENCRICYDLIDDTAIKGKWRIDNVNQDVIKKQIEQFDNNKSHYSVRGKWLLFFMAELGEFMRLHPSFFAPSLEKTEKIPPTCAVASSQSLTALAPTCSPNIPDSLKEFLTNTYVKYINEYMQISYTA